MAVDGCSISERLLSEVMRITNGPQLAVDALVSDVSSTRRLKLQTPSVETDAGQILIVVVLF